MPDVIVDTSAVQYLYQLKLFNLLSNLYSQVIIPAGVASEIAQGLALGVSLPNLNAFTWVKTVPVSAEQLIPTLPNLGMGEREVISLAVNMPDSDVLLDVLAKRQPFVAASARALNTVMQNQVQGYVSGHAVTNIFYILRRQVSNEVARELSCSTFNLHN
ncbi:MAG: PIN domain-containing protein [Nostoc sp.]